MENSKKRYILYAVIVILTFALIVSFAEIRDLKSTISNTQANYEMRINSLETRINSVSADFESKLQKQASLLSGTEVSYGTLDVVNHTVPLTITVIPKSVSDDTQMSVNIGGENTVLTRNGDRFFTTVNIGLFEVSDFPLLSIKNGNITQTEYLEDVDTDLIYSRYLPHVFASGVADVEYKNSKATVDGNIIIEYKPASGGADILLKSYELVATADGEEIDRKDITDEITSAKGVYFPFTETYKIPEYDELRLYVEAVDSLGYRHKTLVELSYYHEESMSTTESTEVVYGGEWIYDKNGNLLYGEE